MGTISQPTDPLSAEHADGLTDLQLVVVEHCDPRQIPETVLRILGVKQIESRAHFALALKQAINGNGESAARFLLDSLPGHLQAE